VVRAVENLTISYVLDPPSVPRETIVTEITTLLTAYLANRLSPAAAGEPTSTQGQGEGR
jgi:hypothetical protein